VWTEFDVEALALAGRDPLIRRFRASQPATTDEVREWLARVEPGRVRGELLELAVADSATAEVVRAVTVWSVSFEHRTASINYSGLPEERGRGVAVRALRLVAQWCFERLKLARLQLFIDLENVASQRVAGRLRLRPRGPCGFAY
jgi:RimJ/RimL family protein N-acetyltransferase